MRVIWAWPGVATRTVGVAGAVTPVWSGILGKSSWAIKTEKKKSKNRILLRIHHSKAKALDLDGVVIGVHQFAVAAESK